MNDFPEHFKAGWRDPQGQLRRTLTAEQPRALQALGAERIAFVDGKWRGLMPADWKWTPEREQNVGRKRHLHWD